MSAAAYFAQTFGRAPAICAHAPGRLEFIGNHVDYNGGLVLGAAIDRGVQAALAPRPDHRVRLASSTHDAIVEADLDHLSPLTGRDAWANYPLGVVWAFAQNGHAPATGFELAVTTDLPSGAGLSSSAALELATAVALQNLSGAALARPALARWCRQAENDFVGVPCGILDQGVSLFGEAGRLVLIDCLTESFSTVPLPGAVRCWVFNTGQKHALLDSLYATRRRECEAAFAALRPFFPAAKMLGRLAPDDVRAHLAALTPAQARRARHVTEEIARVRGTLAALAAGDLAAVGRLLVESHQSSRALFENSCAELDFLVDHLLPLPGVFGARLTGGGFGGAVMALTTPEFTADIAAPALAAYTAKFGHAPTVFTTRTGDGARVLA